MAAPQISDAELAATAVVQAPDRSLAKSSCRRGKIIRGEGPLPGSPAYIGRMADHSGNRTGWSWGPGIIIGIALGVAMDNWFLGLALGAALAPAFAVAMRSQNDDSGGDDGDDTPDR